MPLAAALPGRLPSAQGKEETRPWPTQSSHSAAFSPQRSRSGESFLLPPPQPLAPSTPLPLFDSPRPLGAGLTLVSPARAAALLLRGPNASHSAASSAYAGVPNPAPVSLASGSRGGGGALQAQARSSAPPPLPRFQTHEQFLAAQEARTPHTLLPHIRKAHAGTPGGGAGGGPGAQWVAVEPPGGHARAEAPPTASGGLRLAAPVPAAAAERAGGGGARRILAGQGSLLTFSNNPMHLAAAARQSPLRQSPQW